MNLLHDLLHYVGRDLRPACYRRLARHVRPPLLGRLLSPWAGGPWSPGRERMTRAPGRFLFDPDDRPAMAELVGRLFPHAAEQAEAAADRVLAHEVDLLGSGPVPQGPRLDWQRDFKSGWRWPRRYYADLDVLPLRDGADVKVPWELSRFLQVGVLGRAYWLTGRPCYAREFVAQLMDWIEQNPPYLGVNWCCSMEVSLRLLNWIAGYHFFRDAACFHDEVRQALLQSLREHQLHAYCNLEYGYTRNNGGPRQWLNGNHYASDLVGLYVAATLFPARPGWGRLFHRQVQEEILQQVRPDGVHGELAIGYHRLVAELFLLAARVAARSGVPFAPAVRARLRAMLAFTAAYQQPDGAAPPLRDDDDGRVFTFTEQPTRDHRYLLNLGAVCLEAPELRAACPLLQEEALWWLGPQGTQRFFNLPVPAQRPGSQVFPRSGFGVLRQHNDHLIGLCAGLGLDGAGGHAHNDALSFELVARGHRLFVDPGTYCYSADPAWRDLFRSTALHNTVRVDECEINSLLPGQLFHLADDARPRLEHWGSRPEADWLVGRHEGFGKLAAPVRHRRLLFYARRDRYWVLSDRLSGRGRHLVEIFFQVGPGFEVAPAPATQTPAGESAPGGHGGGNAPVRLRHRDGFVCTLVPQLPPGFELLVGPGWMSPAYGVKQPIVKICFRGQVRVPVRWRFVIWPTAPEKVAPLEWQ